MFRYESQRLETFIEEQMKKVISFEKLLIVINLFLLNHSIIENKILFLH